jgi:hypothetical protein
MSEISRLLGLARSTVDKILAEQASSADGSHTDHDLGGTP